MISTSLENHQLNSPENFPRELTDYIFLNCERKQFLNLCSVDKHTKEVVRRQLIESLPPPSLVEEDMFDAAALKLGVDIRSLMSHLRQDHDKLPLRERAWLLAYDLPAHAQAIGMVSLFQIGYLVKALSNYHQTGLLDGVFEAPLSSTMKQIEVFQNACTRQNLANFPSSRFEDLENYLNKYCRSEISDISSLPSFERKLIKSLPSPFLHFKRFQNGQFASRIENLCKEILFSVPKEMIRGFKDPDSAFRCLPHELLHKIMMEYLGIEK